LNPLPRALLALSLAAASRLAAADPAPPDLSGPWPQTFTEGERTLSLYSPDPVRWDGATLEMQAAVAVGQAGATVYGTVEFVGRTQSDGKTVHVDDVRVSKAAFPGAKGEQKTLRQLLERHVPTRFDLPLGKLQEDLAIAAATRPQRRGPVRNDPPAFAFRQAPALLVLVDGAPQVRDVSGTPYRRVVNTRPLLVLDPATGRHYLRLLDGWMEAPALAGPYAAAASAPPGLGAVLEWAKKNPQVDLLAARAQADAPEATAATGERPTLAKGAPDVVVATVPTELVVTEGAPQLEPIAEAGVLYWKNTTSDVLVDTASGQLYVLAAGRWFRAATADGPFTYVDPASLPPGFARIPPGHAKESVLASVPATPQSREAVVANRVPHTATVRRDAVALDPVYDGPPDLAPIEGTTLSYVPNGSVPVIRVREGEWYGLRDGVWFVAPTANGPWSVATHVDPAIYAIPPSSPLHYVTYVRVYGATPDVVYVGYTPGYYGTVVSSGVVVYGTGYYYRPWVGAWWWGPPVTYGCGMRVYWSSWGGWGLTVSYGWRPWGYHWGFGVAPYWGAMYPYRPFYYPAPVPGYWGYRPAPPVPGAAVGAYGTWRSAGVAAPPRPAPAVASAPVSSARPPAPAATALHAGQPATAARPAQAKAASGKAGGKPAGQKGGKGTHPNAAKHPGPHAR